MSPRLLLVPLLVLLAFESASALEPILLKEATDAGAVVGAPCALVGNTNGTAANYRWYNLCSGYVWIYNIPGNTSMGVLFGGDEQPMVQGDNDVKRAITYWRNVAFGYAQTVEVTVSADIEGDGCPDFALATDPDLDPGLRWNCSDFNVAIPCDTDYLIVRGQKNGGDAPYFATDGPFSQECDPNSPPRSFYYGVHGALCVPWVGENGDPDNLLFWLVLDVGVPCSPNATNAMSWGAIKGLYR